ncbi:hypothetical protein BDZ91DRAFT_723326 [Kalaharituber pfeilii]|nr:hypothetical protein BDZ91DRAFT_723326 [Kalaharituber pfeilii]
MKEFRLSVRFNTLIGHHQKWATLMSNLDGVYGKQCHSGLIFIASTIKLRMVLVHWEITLFFLTTWCFHFSFSFSFHDYDISTPIPPSGMTNCRTWSG